MARLRFALPLVLLALSACGGGDEPEEAAAPTAAPGTTTDIVSIAIDPSDGTLLAGSGPAFYRLPPGADKPELAKGALATPKGAGTLTKDVVVRFEKPGTIIASGHSGEAALPPVLGLLRSTDMGESWEPISGLGEADYHEIEIAGSRIFALRNEDPGMIQVSDDGGKTWETREAPSVAAPIDVAVNPGDEDVWAVSTDQGVVRLHQRAASPGASATRPSARASPGAPRTRCTPRARTARSRRAPTAASSWQDVGSIGAGPKELIVSPKGELYASVAGPEIRRSTDGGKSWTKVIAHRAEGGSAARIEGMAFHRGGDSSDPVRGSGSATPSTASPIPPSWPPAPSPARSATRPSPPVAGRCARWSRSRARTAATPAPFATSCRWRRRRGPRTSRCGCGLGVGGREREGQLLA